MRLLSMSQTRRHHHLAAAQARAVGNAERRLVLEARPGCRLEQSRDVVHGEDTRQLARVIDAGELMREIEAAERLAEEEAQR
jgi:hypothetical protein